MGVYLYQLKSNWKIRRNLNSDSVSIWLFITFGERERGNTVKGDSVFL